jgi:hypothetical protein
MKKGSAMDCKGKTTVGQRPPGFDDVRYAISRLQKQKALLRTMKLIASCPDQALNLDSALDYAKEALSALLS